LQLRPSKKKKGKRDQKGRPWGGGTNLGCGAIKREMKVHGTHPQNRGRNEKKRDYKTRKTESINSSSALGKRGGRKTRWV